MRKIRTSTGFMSAPVAGASVAAAKNYARMQDPAALGKMIQKIGGPVKATSKALIQKIAAAAKAGDTTLLAKSAKAFFSAGGSMHSLVGLAIPIKLMTDIVSPASKFKGIKGKPV